jgi:hypothetical protein
VNRNFVKKIASQELQLASDTKAIVFTEAQIVKHIEVQIEDELGFAACMREFAICESASNGQKMIGNALHGGNDDSNTGVLRGGVNEARGMEHALRSEK